MSSEQCREFQLRENEMKQVLMGDNNDDENQLILDEEDQELIAQDLDHGVTTVEI